MAWQLPDTMLQNTLLEARLRRDALRELRLLLGAGEGEHPCLDSPHLDSPHLELTRYGGSSEELVNGEEPPRGSSSLASGIKDAST